MVKAREGYPTLGSRASTGKLGFPPQGILRECFNSILLVARSNGIKTSSLCRMPKGDMKMTQKGKTRKMP